MVAQVDDWGCLCRVWHFVSAQAFRYSDGHRGLYRRDRGRYGSCADGGVCPERCRVAQIWKSNIIHIPATERFKALAACLIWFELPEKALSDPYWFCAYAFVRATAEDMQVLREVLSDDALREALDILESDDGAPPATPVPQRRFPETPKPA